MRFLTVDDSKTMRNIIKKTLSLFDGAEVFEAADGAEGLAAFQQNNPIDLVLLDWNMPNMDGLTMLTKLRETNKTVPVIMVTTEAEKPRIVAAIKAGANNYVIKPFTGDALKEKIEETLKKAGQPA